MAVLKHNNNLLVLATCIRSGRECGNILHVRDEQVMRQSGTHGSVHSRLLSRNTNKMQLCNRIYYPKVFQRLNMFRAAHRSSSEALNCICSLWFICPYGDRPLSRLSGHWISAHSALTTAGHHMGI